MAGPGEQDKKPDIVPEDSAPRRQLFSEDLRKDVKTPKKHNLILVVGLLLAGLVGVAALVWFAIGYRPPFEVPPDLTVVLTNFKTDDILGVEITPKDSEAFTVEYNPTVGEYRMADADGVKFNQTSMRDIYTTGLSLIATRTIDEAPESLEPFGLEIPTARVTLYHVNGQAFSFALGNKLPAGDGYYLKREGEDPVYAVSLITGTRLSQNANDMRDLDVAEKVLVDYAEYILIERKDMPTIELKQDLSAQVNTWLLTQPVELKADLAAVTELCEIMSAFQLRSYVATTSDYAQYGLDDPAASVLYKDSEGNTLNFHVGGVSDDISETYVRLEGSDEIYTVNNRYIAYIKDTGISTVVSKFAAMVNIDTISEVQLAFEGNRYRMAVGKNGGLNEFRVDGVQVDENLFRKVYEEIIGIRVRGEVTHEEPMGTPTSPVVTVEFALKNGGSTVVAYTPYSQDYYTISIDGSAPLLYTRRDEVNRVFDAVNLLKSMPKALDKEAVNSMVIEKDGQTVAAGRDAIGAESFERLCSNLLTVACSGMTSDRMNTETSFTVRFTYTDGRTPITLEYYLIANGQYAYGIPGASIRFTAASASVDDRLSAILTASRQ